MKKLHLDVLILQYDKRWQLIQKVYQGQELLLNILLLIASFLHYPLIGAHV